MKFLLSLHLREKFEGEGAVVILTARNYVTVIVTTEKPI